MNPITSDLNFVLSLGRRMSTRSSRRSGGAAPGGPNPYTLEGKTVAELRSLLADRGLPTGGSKANLVLRLQDALLNAAAAPEVPRLFGFLLRSSRLNYYLRQRLRRLPSSRRCLRRVRR